MDQLVNLFNSITPLSKGLSDYLKSILKAPKLIKKKQILLHEGEIAKDIYFIENGLLRSYFTVAGMDKTMWIMKEKDLVVSIISFFGQTPSYETLEALENCVLWGINYDQLLYIYHHFPEFHVHRAEILEKYYVLSEERNFIRMQDITSRYEQLLKNEPELMKRVPQKYLASYLGIAEETLSRIRSRYSH